VLGGASVSWLNKEECLVSLHKPQEAAQVKDAMEKAARKSKSYKFQTVAQYKASKASHKTQSSPTGGRRRKSSENQSEHSAAKKHKNANGKKRVRKHAGFCGSNLNYVA
jgi:phosphatidylserine/phosphatidylglycerophosphate/cardiolipin synthase-like enzyme